MKTVKFRKHFLTVATGVIASIGAWFGRDLMKWIIGLPQDSTLRDIFIWAAGALLIMIPLGVIAHTVDWAIKRKNRTGSGGG